ncbi:MAG: polymer-forming cytoskeletal protein [Deltaproteobacteria bacterium]|nr:polymer-forming cytoskeletal protein [Deltaproteobacteria bacterium]
MAGASSVGVIGKGITIRGSLSGGGDLVIEGQVEGQVALKNHLTIESGGRVQATVKAADLTVHGTAEGDIEASGRVHLSSTARVSGDVKAAQVVLEDGAVFNGTIEMDVKLPDVLQER